jgi:murein DD-endopeptidase MepM/ murein hydrolase activator NlpD
MSKVIRAVIAASLVAIVLPAGVTAHWPIVDRYSYISQGYSSGHRAIDIAAPRGTRVVPIRSGRVAFAGWRSDGGGYRVVVYHGYGLYTAYYHLSKIAVYKGKWVYDQRTTLGYVGSSGDATGPHTHTEVWRNGFPWHSGAYRVNPWWYIASGWYLPYRYRYA